MKILAIEFSSAQKSVAVFRSDWSDENSQEILETGERSTHALAMIEEILRQSQLEREQVDCLAIGLGPGSYTGIRSAIALAQGWELARPPGSLNLLGISSMEALAAQAQIEGILGSVALMVDAQRNEFYLAEYEVSSEAFRPTTALSLASFEEVQQRQTAGAQLAGPGAPKRFPGSRNLFPHAAGVARLAASRSDFILAEKLQPIYLRETAFVKAPARPTL
ncbi:MAG: tRNA (adenosine(37)-N6)-threonylcarbamoyltransferase complex dimerization subunit type 1 TsaB [Verrucomicrobia bacterium]|nr:MAG: tRNA (adenosine(37)-N6)-threonylcarbamoyltransferase complex dimerization subunit type 1 TsaB [Verrucomicrobiota bacterium]